ncbi:hypothetical protein GOP47_0022614 [Adiantum capillus-veneris]|uniref:Cyclin-dependent kinases regulatory subunit n=1 Tax=Adiantum capillus-veneris TaxID=13818 RepID=A0A9D4U660_ADICA|nr:hypothetical protein GOP47_0022614 [Adiantum capillus-veneris]
MPKQGIVYSEKYYDDAYEYRHVVLTPEITKLLPEHPRLLSEMEWRSLGVQQSRGWVHYAIHNPERHILLFRRPLNYQQNQSQQMIGRPLQLHVQASQAGKMNAQDVPKGFD